MITSAGGGKSGLGLPVVQRAAGIGTDGMVKSGLGAWGRLWRTQRAVNGAAAGMDFQGSEVLTCYIQAVRSL